MGIKEVMEIVGEGRNSTNHLRKIRKTTNKMSFILEKIRKTKFIGISHRVICSTSPNLA